MPRQYKKRSYQSRSGHGRPTYVRCNKKVISDASKALAMAKYLKSVVNVEFKNHDVQVTNTAISSTAVISQLTNIE